MAHTTHTAPNRRAVDDVMEHLANDDRRAILRYVAEHGDDTLSRRQLLDHLAARSNGAPDRRRLDVCLHHLHLPALAAEDVLGYDADVGAVRKGSDWHLVRPYLTAFDDA